MTNNQWKVLFDKAIKDITSATPTGNAVDDMWNLATTEDPEQTNIQLQTAMYLLFAYEKNPSLHAADAKFFPVALATLFPEA